eukprot:jgi/Botrbrau1/14030/Bobra.0310s0015.1
MRPGGLFWRRKKDDDDDRGDETAVLSTAMWPARNRSIPLADYVPCISILLSARSAYHFSSLSAGWICKKHNLRLLLFLHIKSRCNVLATLHKQ